MLAKVETPPPLEKTAGSIRLSCEPGYFPRSSWNSFGLGDGSPLAIQKGFPPRGQTAHRSESGLTDGSASRPEDGPNRRPIIH